MRSQRNLRKDGIPKPAEWTDQDALELALEVYPPRSAEGGKAASAAEPASAAVAATVRRVIGLKPENLRYLQLDYHVTSTLDRRPASYDAEQVEALREIAAAIKIRR
jgi:hypothetical protein